MQCTKDFLQRGLQWMLLALVFTPYSTALVSKAELPKELQDCYNSYGNFTLRDIVGQSLCWSCEAPVIRRLRTSGIRSTYPPSTIAYIKRLLDKANIVDGNRVKRQTSPRCLKEYRMLTDEERNRCHRAINILKQDTSTPPSRNDGKRVKRQTGPRCRRKEYRMLTDEERNRFHRAINILKQDTSIPPNRYDALAQLHSGPALDPAHGGPNFLGWHRVYLYLYERALQDVDPSICLPYWDSSLDNELPVPRTSYVFSPDFLGGRGSNGPVTDGPFAGWVTPSFGSLSRNIGATPGSLFDIADINNILSQTRTIQITRPFGNPANVLENHHDGVHIFIGGQMGRLPSAAHDPVFFLHHCFVDYIWEVFRTKQRALGIDPQQDYPSRFPEYHEPDRLMGFPNMTITALEGYSDRWTETYEYEPTPTCSSVSPTCGSPYLRCDVQIDRCIPIEPPGFSSVSASASDDAASSLGSPTAIQNSFCIDGECDTREWVYMPVEVVSLRSPELETYKSYPSYNRTIEKHFDIYHSSLYPETNRHIFTGAPKSYRKCRGNGIGQIFVQSNGLSYDGFYKESVIIDQRLATSIALGYVAVKDPKNGPVKALFRAFDSCGRICNTAYRTPGTRDYKPFSGVLDIEDIPGRPQQYSKTYGQAFLNTWGYSSNQQCPSFNDNDVVLTFYCDYSEDIPWVKRDSLPVPLAVTNEPKPVPTFAPSPSSNECRVDEECTIDVPCSSAKTFCMGERYKCRGTCNKYAECYFGYFFKQCCRSDWSYDEWRYECTPNRRCESFAFLYPPLK